MVYNLDSLPSYLHNSDKESFKLSFAKRGASFTNDCSWGVKPSKDVLLEELGDHPSIIGR